MVILKRMRAFFLVAVTLSLTVVGSAQVASQGDSQIAGVEPDADAKVVLVSEVNWGPLNPARGDASPRAGTLWGDRSGSGPTGFLVEFAEGFSSPPHIHNVSYRGVVISGLIHNDDPDSAPMWMPPGSFWTQPAGEIHITAAEGSHNLAYIEIEKGPYLVRPKEKAFDNGERPVNVDASNIVWLDASNSTWISQSGISASAGGPQIAFLWGSPQDDHLSGALVKLPVGFSGKLESRGASFRAVVIQGLLQYQAAGKTGVKTLEPGSYFSSIGKSVHQVSCESQEECIIYVRMDGRVKVSPAPPRN